MLHEKKELRQIRETMIRIAEKLIHGKTLLCDGAWGTTLFEMGLQPGVSPEEWNITHSDKIGKVARSYVEAGVDIVETNSFGGSPIRLRDFCLENKAFEINRIAAEISRNEAGADIYVAGSIGPSGKMIIPGDVTEQELYESFALQAKALEKGGADLIVVETMIDTAELSIAVRAAKENCSLDVIASASYDRSPMGFRTMMGASIKEMSESAIEAGAAVIGTNCGYGTDMMVEIVREMRLLFPRLPILVEPNAGVPIITDTGQLQFPESPEYMAARAKSLVKAGANIIGGCCGTTPAHIKAIGEAIRAR